eukprot:365733-Chlamydomonas_euryale.AAC.21
MSASHVCHTGATRQAGRWPHARLAVFPLYLTRGTMDQPFDATQRTTGPEESAVGQAHATGWIVPHHACHPPPSHPCGSAGPRHLRGMHELMRPKGDRHASGRALHALGQRRAAVET